MASTSSAPIPYKYEVFLSFRGDDTRHSFTDHLYKALHDSAITTFRDDDEIREGEELKSEIEIAITESRASIIVFSERFADSSWCLDELSLILEQKRKRNHFVLAVFYGVDPSDVRNQRGSFKIEAKEGTKWTEDNVKRWKAALTDAANLKGMVVSGSETAFIEDIVHKVYCELDLKLVNIPTDLTGIETRAEAINSLLKNEQPAVLAICGMGGGGKTTLAKYIYNSKKQHFECSSFLEGIENQPHVLLRLQNQLLRDVLGTNIRISNVSEGTSHIEKAIQMKKALIVVDDIDDQEQLSALFGTKVFQTRSKIIITTRFLKIGTWHKSIAHGCDVYEIELLNDHESLELLSCHAFGLKIPKEGFEEVTIQLARYCGGNPLALKVLGSSLSEETEIEMWRSTMNSLDSLKGDLDYKIQCVLQKSFESLQRESHKELFLHIACLFVDYETRYHVETVLEDDYYAKSGMVTLINRCLLTNSNDGFVRMHKLLQDMARNIVRNKSKDPAKHSRVWRRDECCSLLRKGDGSKTIEGLLLDMYGAEEEVFKTSSLEKMKNLKYLHLYFVKLTGSNNTFPDLRWLKWWGCNLKTLPPGLYLSSSLVSIDMSHGDLEVFEPPIVLNSLKFLVLISSDKLVSINNLSRLPKLETLFLHGCTSLTHVCKTIGDLKNLSTLDLGECTQLWKASFKQELLSWLKSLFISVSEEPLLSLPQSLHYLNLADNLFEIMPNHIDLKMLTRLHLTCCQNLKSIRCLPATLKELDVSWCASLERIAFQSARFTLQVFNYEGCFKLCEIQGLFKLVSIAEVDEADLGKMQWIKAYQDFKVDLVGDVITEGRTFNIQMLCEYGIRSIYLQGIKDQSMATHDYTSSLQFLSFRVPLHSKKNRIKGVNVTILYRPSSYENKDTYMWPLLFAKISNRTKGYDFVYSPVVYCKPRADEEVVWLSYWPIKLDAGDEVDVTLIPDQSVLIVKGCGASLVYMDDGEEEECDERMKEEEVIGGDLSVFEVTKGGYYLCRVDFFKSVTPHMLKKYLSMSGDNIQYTADSHRWRLSHKFSSNMKTDTLRNNNRRRIKLTLGVSLTNESETDKIEKAVSGLAGVEFVYIDKEIGRLYVFGSLDVEALITCVRKYEKVVQILRYY